MRAAPLVIVALLALFASAAPKLKSDCVEGELRLSGIRDPIVIRKERTPEGTFVDVTYWLVFTSAETESACVKIGNGVPVKVTGTIAHGGQYRYVIVERVCE